VKPALSRIRHARIAQLAAAAAGGGLLSAGGYALAAGGSSTIHACVDRSGGHVLHVQARCHRGQRGISWNQRGRQGATGPQGPAGPAGQSPVTAWAGVNNAGTVFAGHGISAQHVSAGTYQLTATPAQCVQGTNTPVVTVSDAYPPNGTGSATAFPVAWVQLGGVNTFTVYTGVVGGGSFTLTDHTFDVQDPCS
jgi:hypothetical protein